MWVAYVGVRIIIACVGVLIGTESKSVAYGFAAAFALYTIVVTIENKKGA